MTKVQKKIKQERQKHVVHIDILFIYSFILINKLKYKICNEQVIMVDVTRYTREGTFIIISKYV